MRVISVIRKILAVPCFIMAVGGLAAIPGSKGNTAAVIADVIIAAFFAAAGLLLLFKKGQTPEQKAKKAEAKAAKEALKDRQSRTLSAQHMAGLPIAEGVSCKLEFDDERVMIAGGGNTFGVALNKITDLQTKTKTEIQKSYVSSAGGAIAGAAVFGPLGAMVGGRVKEKTSRISEHFLIITYNKEGVLDYVSFGIHDAVKASKLVQRYKPLCTGKAIHTDL